MNHHIFLLALGLGAVGVLLAAYTESYVTMLYDPILDVTYRGPDLVVRPYQTWGLILLLVGGVTGFISLFVPPMSSQSEAIDRSEE